jgi:large subunit ribosomal protein L24
MSAKIKKGDTVEVLTGKHKGKRGTVLHVHREAGRVIVEGVNLVKRHQKPNAQYRQGGIIEREAPVHVSNVALIHDGERTRVGLREVDGRKVRWSRKHDEAIDG